MQTQLSLLKKLHWLKEWLPLRDGKQTPLLLSGGSSDLITLIFTQRLISLPIGKRASLRLRGSG